MLGVEPDERMAQWAGQCGLVVGVATFETWDPAGRTFDAVIEGQSWHWVEPVAGAVKAAAVLRPAGRLALSVACRWQAVSGVEAPNTKEHDDDDVGPFAFT